MLPSLEFFRNDPCPFFRAGLCDRPHCPFRHNSSTDVDIFEEKPNEVMHGKMKMPVSKSGGSNRTIHSNLQENHVFHSNIEDDRLRRDKKINKKNDLRQVLDTKNEERKVVEEVKGKGSEGEKNEEGGKCNAERQGLSPEKFEEIREEKEEEDEKKLEEEYERMLLGEDDEEEDDDFEIDPSVAEQFLLPEDTDSEDPAELADACYKEWLRSREETKKVTVQEKPTIQQSKPNQSHQGSFPDTFVSKKRLAHPNQVETSLNVKQPIGKMLPAPSQILMARYDIIKGSLNRGSTSQGRVNGNTVPPTRNDRPEQPKETMSMKTKTTEIKTIARTLEANSSRKAHSPIRAPPTCPVIRNYNTAIPTNTRQSMLDKLFRACETIYDTYADACERAISEELSLAQKIKNNKVYIGSGAVCLKKLRDEAADIQKGNKTASKVVIGSSATATHSNSSCSSTITNRTQSHQSLLVGPTKHSWSIETKKVPELLEKTNLYKAMKECLLTEAQLVDNGYPREHPSGDRGRITTKNRKHKNSYNGDSKSRVCDRCGKPFHVGLDGVPLIKQFCYHHPGRNFKRKHRGVFETRFNCCDGESNSMGCCVANVHVSAHPSDEIYGFVTAIKDPGNEDTMGNDPWDIVALDCEMIYTTYGCELARATFVSVHKKILYDELVKPIHPIIDFNTRYSGITAEMMEGVTTSLTDVQAVMLTRFRPNTILIGHSLESDLLALKLKHDQVIDTAILMPHRLGLPYKRALRNLASDCLGKIIQTGEEGHDSAEDALSALEVALWKIQGDRLLNTTQSKRFKS